MKILIKNAMCEKNSLENNLKVKNRENCFKNNSLRVIFY